MSENTPQETRVGHCKADETDVYAGRGQNGRHMLSVPPTGRGWLGNPFTVEEYEREESIEMFRKAFFNKLNRDEEFREAVAELHGQTLGCWCQRLDEGSPACHAEIIAKAADRLAEREEHCILCGKPPERDIEADTGVCDECSDMVVTA